MSFLGVQNTGKVFKGKIHCNYICCRGRDHINMNLQIVFIYAQKFAGMHKPGHDSQKHTNNRKNVLQISVNGNLTLLYITRINLHTTHKHFEKKQTKIVKIKNNEHQTTT